MIHHWQMFDCSQTVFNCFAVVDVWNRSRPYLTWAAGSACTQVDYSANPTMSIWPRFPLHILFFLRIGFSFSSFPKHICAGGLYEASGTMCYRLCQEQNSAAGDAKEAKYDFCHQISWEFIKFSTFSTLKYDWFLTPVIMIMMMMTSEAKSARQGPCWILGLNCWIHLWPSHGPPLCEDEEDKDKDKDKDKDEDKDTKFPGWGACF